MVHCQPRSMHQTFHFFTKLLNSWSRKTAVRLGYTNCDNTNLKNLTTKVLVLVIDCYAHKSMGDTICDTSANYRRYYCNRINTTIVTTLTLMAHFILYTCSSFLIKGYYILRKKKTIQKRLLQTSKIKSRMQC